MTNSSATKWNTSEDWERSEKLIIRWCEKTQTRKMATWNHNQLRAPDQVAQKSSKLGKIRKREKLEDDEKGGADLERVHEQVTRKHVELHKKFSTTGHNFRIRNMGRRRCGHGLRRGVQGAPSHEEGAILIRGATSKVETGSTGCGLVKRRQNAEKKWSTTKRQQRRYRHTCGNPQQNGKNNRRSNRRRSCGSFGRKSYSAITR